MLPITQLKTIFNTIVNQDTTPLQLVETLKSYKALLLKATDINLESEEHKQDIHSHNGIAIGTTWAAACIDDFVRTKQFIKGIQYSIEDIKKTKKEIIHILYAGTGPFATLILPILSQYNPEQIQVTLLDINPKSIKNLRSVINYFELKNYVKSIVCTDATKYKIKEQPDIILSETMQNSLLKEQQVPIMLNLISQVDKNTIIIPKNIELTLGYVKRKVDFDLKGVEKQYKTIAPILNFNQSHVYNYLKNNCATDYSLEKNIVLQENNDKDYSTLAILTKIEVVDNININYNESGLTIPHFLFDTRETKPKKITLKYVLEPAPIFTYTIA